MHFDSKHEGHNSDELIDLNLNLIVHAQVQVHVNDGSQYSLLLEIVFFPQL